MLPLLFLVQMAKIKIAHARVGNWNFNILSLCVKPTEVD